MRQSCPKNVRKVTGYIMNEDQIKNLLPTLPLRDIVVFPHMIVPLFVGRKKSIKALEAVMKGDKRILLLSQKEASNEDPQEEDLYDVGTIGSVLQLLKLPDGTVKVLIEGLHRAKTLQFIPHKDFFAAQTELIIENVDHEQQEIKALMRATISQFEKYIKLSSKIPPEVFATVSKIDNPSKLADTIASHLSIKISEKQELLEMPLLEDRLKTVFTKMEDEIDLLQVEKRIKSNVKKQMEKTQREYYLNEQIKAIQKELGDGSEAPDENQEIEEKISNTKLSKEAKEKAKSEHRKLKAMSPMAAEATVVRNYLDWILGIPWKKFSRVNKDIKKAEDILEADHFGLEKVKERILEYLAVQKKTNQIRGPILCFVGPPGVGKTSLGKSIAKATGRKFARLALGGVRDESEIRGHRRTYIGSMPGKIIQGMRKANSSNPLFLLDEIDKLGADWRGDPSSALLEVLDPEQNNSFNDHYLEVDYDLSKVMFVCTANTMNIPQPLLDRMEIIRIPGYTEDEKIEIAKRHLIEKQRKENGLKKSEWALTDDAITDIIRYYTKEAGVRNLEREIANLARKSVRKLVTEDIKSIKITPKNINEFAGVQKFRFGEAEHDDMVGAVTGLAWTQFGGELLTIEAVMLPGKGKMMITGKLGDVMQESIKAAASYVRAQAIQFGIHPKIFDHKDIHIHVPEGATPKDGPSAGVGMITSIVSVLTGIKVSKDIAMTGEITLRGRVLAIGGLKEKLLAALRGGIKTVLIPKDNEKDLEEIPENVKTGLKIIPVSYVTEVLEHALLGELIPLEWTEEDEKSLISDNKQQKTDESGLITH